MVTEQRDFVSLLEDVRAGDTGAFNHLVPVLEPIVKKAVRRFVGKGRENYPIDDFMQEGWDAACRALYNYDAERYPVLVHSYFYNAVISRLISVNNGTYMLTLPRALKRFLRDVAGGKVDWSLSDDELQASYPMLDVCDIGDVRNRNTEFFDVMLATDVDLYSQFDSNNRQVQERFSPIEGKVVDHIVARDVLCGLLAQLTEREYRVFVLRFVNERPRTVVAQELGCSVVTIANIEKSILRKRAS